MVGVGNLARWGENLIWRTLCKNKLFKSAITVGGSPIDKHMVTVAFRTCETAN